MKGVSRELIEAIVRQYMPEDVTIVMATHEFYMMQARQHPWITLQVKLGIYDEATIGDEFLSPMCSYVANGVLDVDYELIQKHMEDVDTINAIGYVSEIALHERHHFVEHAEPNDDLLKQAQREHDCNEEVANKYPIVHALYEEACRQSSTISRVMERMKHVT